ncbi:hypothetical protein F5148DRAFT_1150353 [Russula earlei]|uniref:Uncharacterized protein n=1 Tax=Russula earlei TaxID=71964 RepID=A0ACC0U521_9AGAM|nr:hypothetical protein F5148DRAFT_1150353 [Russula earlei]
MLGFDPFAPTYPPHIQDNDSLFRLHHMQADPIAYNPYSPPSTPAGKFAFNLPPAPPTPTFPSSPAFQSFTFDPFADEDSSTSSGASERERELEVQRLRGIELLRRREWIRRVVAWVDGVSHGTTPSLSPSPSSSKSAPSPRPYNYTQQSDPADSPTLYYSSSQSLAGRSDDRSDEDDEPYLIYSTPLPGNAHLSFVPPSPSPSPSPPVPKPAAPAPVYTPAVPPPHISPPPQASSSRRIHGRMRSLSSIREEDEGGA